MLLVGTGNQHKLGEISSILGDLPIEVVGTGVLPPSHEEIEETGTTFPANAEIKARAFAERALALPADERPRWVIADDSGLCVDALDGAPGVHSARYAGPGADSEANNSKLLQELREVSEGRRDAAFVCSICCVGVPAEGDGPIDVLFTSEGRCGGRIAFEPYGEGGFGYDPLFIETSTGVTFAELSADEKNRRSHRGLALADFRAKLLEIL